MAGDRIPWNVILSRVENLSFSDGYMGSSDRNKSHRLPRQGFVTDSSP